MGAFRNSGPWAVYQMNIRGNPHVARVICEQREWDNLEKRQEDGYVLIRGWIQNEAEAERLARETPTLKDQVVGNSPTQSDVPVHSPSPK